MTKIKPRFPVREFLGKFEAWLLVMKGGHVMRCYDGVLERLFKMFPKRTGIEQFVSMDIGDYVAVRTKQGAAQLSLNHELSMLSNFFKWCQEDQHLKVYNPAKIYIGHWKTEKVPNHKIFTLDKLNRLLDAVPLKEKRIILSVIQGGECPRYRAGNVIREAAKQLGFEGFSMGALKRASKNRLGREIIEYYCRQVSNTLPPEAQCYGDTLATVQRAAPNERPAICDSYNYPLICNGINQQ
jgi:hypothetical protein